MINFSNNISLKINIKKHLGILLQKCCCLLHDKDIKKYIKYNFQYILIIIFIMETISND